MLKNLRSKSAVILHESNVLLLTGRTPSNAILECFKVAVNKTLQKTAGLYACLFMIYVTRNDWKKYQNIKFRQFPTKLSQGWKQQKHTPRNNCNDSYISTFVLLSRLAFQFVHFNFQCHAKGEGKKTVSPKRQNSFHLGESDEGRDILPAWMISAAAEACTPQWD